jgi:fatty acid desaturase
MIGLMLQSALFGACGVALFFAESWLLYLAPVYWAALVVLLLDRFTLMLHCTSHRPLFNSKYRFLNWGIPWVIGPFMGQTPESYFAHHMGMHHVEENLPGDLSSTLCFQRDRFSHWLRYFARFIVYGLPELVLYFRRRNRSRLLRRVLIGEGAYWLVMLALGTWKPAAVLVVFVGPLLLIRTLMMIGNWGQHAFVSATHPDKPHLSSITCINTRYNRRCFNDGYHIGHHLNARSHWTEYPTEYRNNLREYGRQDAIVFDGLDFFTVWLLLMTGRWTRLARGFVRLPGAPERDESAIIALLKHRVRAVPAR